VTGNQKIDSRREAAGEELRLGFVAKMASLPGPHFFCSGHAFIRALPSPRSVSNRVSRWRKSGCVEEFVLRILRSGMNEWYG
jgi:hypothetical protein